jgi:hypothetical protein
MRIRSLISDGVFLEIFRWDGGFCAWIRLDVRGCARDARFGGATFLSGLLSITCCLIALGSFAFRLLGYGLTCRPVASACLTLYDCCFDLHASIVKVALMVLY